MEKGIPKLETIESNDSTNTFRVIIKTQHGIALRQTDKDTAD